MALKRIVVVGASLAGQRAVLALRKRGYDGELVLVGAEPHAPYDRPPLSKQVLLGEWPKEKLVLRKEGYDELGVSLRLGARVRSLSPRDRLLVLEDGAELSYEGLLIATGAAPRVLPMAAVLAGVHVLRTLDDALAIREALAGRPRVVVIGGGFIGLEVASSCRKLGLSVTLVEALELPLVRLLGARVGEAVARMHADEGVTLRCSARVEALEGAGRVERVRLADGSVLDAELVVVGVGVVPETAWLEGSGVTLSDGVLCDARCATNVPDVVAAGDVARWPNPLFGETMRVEHWSNAVEQAQAAATRLLDGEAAPAFSPVPYFWSDQYDVKLQFAGRVRPDDELVVVEGSLAERKYVALYGRQGRLSGVLACNRPQQLVRFRKLIAERSSFDDAVGAKPA